VLAGIDGRTSTRQLVEHNLLGTVNVLEFCRQHGAGLVLLSTSRVYSIAMMAALPLAVRDNAFAPVEGSWPAGASPQGITEAFSTAAPVSLYGATKLASEALALEYHDAFGIPVVINRCGVLAGPGQFGTAEQGIFSYWIRSWALARTLRYLGFGGMGHQVRDALHPADLLDLVQRQIARGSSASGIWNVAGGPANAMSLAQLSRRIRRAAGRIVGVGAEVGSAVDGARQPSRAGRIRLAAGGAAWRDPPSDCRASPGASGVARPLTSPWVKPRRRPRR
jgi:CDP-paratose 2-epimerase